MKQYTDIEKANINFFGNMVDISMQIEEIQSFLTDIQKYIEVTNYHLQSDKITGYDKETLENLKYHYEHTHGNTLRKSIIISVIILFESELYTYCQDFQEHKKLKIGYKELKGDLLEKFKCFCQKIINVSFDFNSVLWQDIIGLYEIRNCLIHNYGSLENFGKRKTIENFVKRHKCLGITENEYIEISYKSCVESIAIVNNFFEEITSIALESFPGSYGRKRT